MRVRTRELTMKNGAMPIRVSLPECEVLSTRTKYHAFATAHAPTRSQPCQRVGHSHKPFHILLNQGSFIFLSGRPPSLKLRMGAKALTPLRCVRAAGNRPRAA